MSTINNWADDSSDEDDEESVVSVGNTQPSQIEGGSSNASASAPPVSSDKNGDHQNVIVVDNLNYRTSPEAINEFFQSGGCIIDSISQLKDGTASIQFVDSESYQTSLTADGQELEGRKLRIYSSLEEFQSNRGGGVGGRGGGRGAGYRSGRGRGSDDRRQESGDRRPREYDGKERRPRDQESGDRRPREFEGKDRRPRENDKDWKKSPREIPAVRVPVEPTAPQPPLERKRVILKPRTIPLEASVQPAETAASSIFGDGKPRDATTEVKPTVFAAVHDAVAQVTGQTAQLSVAPLVAAKANPSDTKKTRSPRIPTGDSARPHEDRKGKGDTHRKASGSRSSGPAAAATGGGGGAAAAPSAGAGRGPTRLEKTPKVTARSESAAVAPQPLTDEEKFQRSQKKFEHSAEKSAAALNKEASKQMNGFNALVDDDSEDD